MHDGISVIGGHHHHLVVEQYFFKLPYFGQTARPFGYIGQLMEFTGFLGLDGTSYFHGIVLVGVFWTKVPLSMSPGRHKGSSATELVLVFDVQATVFAFHHLSKRVCPEFATLRTSRGAHVREVDHKAIIHGKIFVGVQQRRHLIEQMTHGSLRVSPIAHSYASTGKIIGQAVGYQVDLQIIVVASCL